MSNPVIILGESHHRINLHSCSPVSLTELHAFFNVVVILHEVIRETVIPSSIVYQSQHKLCRERWPGFCWIIMLKGTTRRIQRTCPLQRQRYELYVTCNAFVRMVLASASFNVCIAMLIICYGTTRLQHITRLSQMLSKKFAIGTLNRILVANYYCPLIYII